MTKDYSGEDYVKHVKRITEGELWDLVETVMENSKNIGVADEIMERDKTEYCSHARAEVVDEEKRNFCMLVTRSRIGM